MHNLNKIHTAKPRLLVSQCLIGDKVRYDGAHKNQSNLAPLWALVDLQAQCPEVAAGMGVPRAPIRRQLHRGSERLALAQTGEIIATNLAQTCDALSASLAYNLTNNKQLCGAILKARSPSCGIADSGLFSLSGELLEQGDGVFVQRLRQANPRLLLVNEEQLHGDTSWRHWYTLCLLKLAAEGQQLDRHWRAHLLRSHPQHSETGLGLSQLSARLGSAELDYLLALPISAGRQLLR